MSVQEELKICKNFFRLLNSKEGREDFTKIMNEKITENQHFRNYCEIMVFNLHKYFVTREQLDGLHILTALHQYDRLFPLFTDKQIEEMKKKEEKVFKEYERSQENLYKYFDEAMKYFPDIKYYLVGYFKVISSGKNPFCLKFVSALICDEEEHNIKYDILKNINGWLNDTYENYLITNKLFEYHRGRDDGIELYELKSRD